MLSNNLGAPAFRESRVGRLLAIALVLVFGLMFWRGEMLWDHLAGNPRGDELLFCSSGSGDLAGIERALDQGADINARDMASLTPLMVACDSQSNEQAVRLLLERGADPNLEAQTGITALYNAVNGDNVELIKLLLSSGVDPNHAPNGETMLDVAIRLDRRRAMNVLIAHGTRTTHATGALFARNLSPSL